MLGIQYFDWLRDSPYKNLQTSVRTSERSVWYASSDLSLLTCNWSDQKLQMWNSTSSLPDSKSNKGHEETVPVSSMPLSGILQVEHLLDFLRLKIIFRFINRWQACSQAMLKRRVIFVHILWFIHGVCLGDRIQVGFYCFQSLFLYEPALLYIFIY